MASDPVSPRLGCPELADAVRWPRMGTGRAAHLRRRVSARRRPTRRTLRIENGSTSDHGLWLTGAAAALPAAHLERRGLVVPRLFRAWFRLRSGIAQDACRTPRR